MLIVCGLGLIYLEFENAQNGSRIKNKCKIQGLRNLSKSTRAQKHQKHFRVQTLELDLYTNFILAVVLKSTALCVNRKKAKKLKEAIIK